MKNLMGRARLWGSQGPTQKTVVCSIMSTIQFKTHRECWRLTHDDKELQIVCLEWPEEERRKVRTPPLATLSEKEREAYYGWVVRRTTRVPVAGLRTVQKKLTVVEVGLDCSDVEYHRLELIVENEERVRTCILTEMVGIDGERPWRDSREEIILLDGIQAFMKRIKEICVLQRDL